MRTLPPLYLHREGPARPDPLSTTRHLAPYKGKNTSGGLIFPMFDPSSINRTMKAVVAKMGYRDGPKFSLHAFRRGATQGIKDIGSTLSAIIQSGTWAHTGYKSYLDIQAGYAINISRFIIDSIGRPR